MNNLLSEYERENKSLNEQILNLLAENKALKLNNIKQESLKASRKNSRKQFG